MKTSNERGAMPEQESCRVCANLVDLNLTNGRLYLEAHYDGEALDECEGSYDEVVRLVHEDPAGAADDARVAYLACQAALTLVDEDPMDLERIARRELANDPAVTVEVVMDIAVQERDDRMQLAADTRAALAEDRFDAEREYRAECAFWAGRS